MSMPLPPEVSFVNWTDQRNGGLKPSRQRGTILLYLIAGIAFLAMLYGLVYWVDTHWETKAGVARGESTKQAEWAAAVAKQRADEEEKIGDASTKKEAGDANAKIVYRTITRTVDKYIDRPIYRNECLDDDGLRDANRALGGPGGAAAGTDKPMPGPGAAGKQDGSGGPAKADRGK